VVSSPPLLELHDVTVIRDGRPALSRVSLSIQDGEHVAILGPNGCGKSTLVKLIDRELYPVAGQGTIRLRGSERWNVSTLRSTLGIVTNDLQGQIDPMLTSVEAVLTGREGKLGLYWSDADDASRSSALSALDRAGAGHLAERKFGSLSSGEARRVLIARALAHRPTALLFDEPTTSLDLVSAHGLLLTLGELARAGTTLVLVTHHFEEIIPEIDRVILLNNGRILADGPREEIMRDDLLSEAFGSRIRLCGDGPYAACVGGPR